MKLDEQNTPFLILFESSEKHFEQTSSRLIKNTENIYISERSWLEGLFIFF
jgi:hypothetical protein